MGRLRSEILLVMILRKFLGERMLAYESYYGGLCLGEPKAYLNIAINNIAV